MEQKAMSVYVVDKQAKRCYRATCETCPRSAPGLHPSTHQHEDLHNMTVPVSKQYSICRDAHATDALSCCPRAQCRLGKTENNAA